MLACMTAGVPVGVATAPTVAVAVVAGLGIGEGAGVGVPESQAVNRRDVIIDSISSLVGTCFI